jgi:drug/metabolite transporter (DMT)-like permease
LAIFSDTGTNRGMPVLLILVMVAWGANIPAIKALTGVLDVMWLAALRMLVATLVLTLGLWLRDRRLPRLSLAKWGYLGGTSFLIIYLNQVMFTHGMGLTTATSASLVMALIPPLSVAAGALLMRERVHKRAMLGIALGFAGVTLVVVMAPGAQLGITGLGEVLLVLGLLAFVGGGLLIQRVAQDIDVLVVGWSTYGMGSLMLLAHAMLDGGWVQARAALDTPMVWGYLMYSGVVGTALANLAWYFAIGRIGQSRASPFLYLLPIFGVLSSALMLGEPLGWWHLFGLVLVIAGTRLGTAPRIAPL